MNPRSFQQEQEFFAVDFTHIEDIDKLIDRIDIEAEYVRGENCNWLNELNKD